MTSPIHEADAPLYFGEWLKRRRQELDLTQAQLAMRASCTVFTIRKIESGERRPSRQLAGLLASSLEIPSENELTFIKVARGELSVERLAGLARDSRPAIAPSPSAGNLPRELTPFIGREPELSMLGQLLQDPHCSLLTIAGMGGIGKTRLAIEAATRYKDLFSDGAWFVSLAALNSTALLAPAIAEAIHFRVQDPVNPLAQLLHYLRDKRALLVLDNAEHLLDGSGVFVEIINACRQVKLLVTSRERLNLLSEWVIEVQGLPMPAGDQVEQFEAYSSVALFLQSARRVRADFTLREDERGWILKICQLMGGMPLGIELSAAWVELLPCKEIAGEIERNLDFLSASMRDLPARQRSLRATLDYSWNLLNADEKLILSRLAVFNGAFRREAAAEICGASLALLSSFRNKMLLNKTDQGLYSLHELIRQYAELKLSENPDEAERVKDRHASYFVDCLSEWEKALKSSQQVETFNEMARIINDLSWGWQRIVTSCRPGSENSHPYDMDLLHSALFSLSLFYEIRCRSWEAVTLFKQSVEYLQTVQGEFEKTEQGTLYDALLGQITAYLGLHHYYVLQVEKARAYLEEAIRLLENSQSRVEKAQAQIMLAHIYQNQGQLKKSVVLHEQSKEVFKEEGEAWWYLLSLINLAFSYLNSGKLVEGEALFQEGFQLIVPGDLRLELTLRIGFAFLHFLQNDYNKAEQLMQDNLKLSDQFQNGHWTAAIYLHLSRIALAAHQVDLAEKYLQENIKLMSQFGETVDFGLSLIYMGKCCAARSDFGAARQKFRQVIRIGHSFNAFHLVYWGWVNIASTWMIEGQTEKALEISLLLSRCSTEYKMAQDEGDRLLANLKAALPEGQFEAAMKRVEGEISANQASAEMLVNDLGIVSLP